MPCAIAGPAPSIEDPCAFTLLTVSNSTAVSKSHRIAPSFVEYARKCPFTAPENTAPGITEIAEDCAAKQPRGLAQVTFGAGVLQIFFPVARSSAEIPGWGVSPRLVNLSETAAYTWVRSAA